MKTRAGVCAAALACGLLLAATARAGEEAPVISVSVAEADLVADLSAVTLSQAHVIKRLIEASRVTDVLYRRQLEPGGFYPTDMTRAEFEGWVDSGVEPLATHPHYATRRGPDGKLVAVPYHQAWPREVAHIARLLAAAAEITDDESLKHYLTLRARALIVGDHPRAKAAWLSPRYSDVDVLMGPLGTDDDAVFGLKSAFGAYVLLRDWAWGARLARLTVFLPELQHELPVSAAFKDEVPAVDRSVSVYDLLYHGGYGMPGMAAAPESVRDRRVRLEHGPRRLQLRNVMRARFDRLVKPAASLLLGPEEQAAVQFEPFFLNIMLRDRAHEMGLHHTVGGRVPVAEALGEYAAVIEEAKATVLSLWLAERLHRRGELPETSPEQHYASFFAGLLYSVHVDPGSVPGRARLIVLSHCRDWGALWRDPKDGRYRVVAERMTEALEALAAHLLTLQGSGDRIGAAELLAHRAVLSPELSADLSRIEAAGLPSRLVFRQGEALLGL